MICFSSATVLTTASFPSPLKGYVYLVFESEKSVRALLQACSQDLLSPDGLSEYYFKMSSRRMRCKEVSRPMRVALQMVAGGVDEILGDKGVHSGTPLQERRAKTEQQKSTWLLAIFN